ncbi:hypothetical protein BFP70_17090 [Thioclava sp. SK-1]|uniref:TetR/AcrR family transcriptional regulator n=1 Tax=Thioclava sp. SK-1 TaxID=1889770 RepID=UPI0008246EDF|nr:TetR/AcrR family transcriptional regulator [Thioclava sp. SK-1]OCX61156.1 hypothetical protein BFP70_17090 [Thioclava sp. SK-1]
MTDDNVQTSRTPGRPRHSETDANIKDVARRMVREHGYRQVSIAQIIKEAGVARQTLYRRWPTKADLILAAFYENAQTPPDPSEMPGTWRDRLEAFLIRIADHLARDGKPIRNLIASAQEDPGFHASFRDQFVVPLDKTMQDLLHHAQQAGELPGGADPQVLCDMIHGLFWYRLLNDQPLTADLARGVVVQVFAGSA